MIGALERVTRLLHILQTLVFTEMGINRLFHYCDGQQCGAFHSILEYIETGFLRVRRMDPTRETKQSSYPQQFI